MEDLMTIMNIRFEEGRAMKAANLYRLHEGPHESRGRGEKGPGG